MIPSSWVLRGKIRGLSTLGYSLGYHTGIAISHNWETLALYSTSLMILSHNLHWPLVCFALGLQSSHHVPRAGLAFHYHDYLPLCWNEAIAALLLWTTDMCQYKETQVSLHFTSWTMTSRRQLPLGSHGYYDPLPNTPHFSEGAWGYF